MEYFGNLGEQQRQAVWGATFQVKDKSENKVGRSRGRARSADRPAVTGNARPAAGGNRSGGARQAVRLSLPDAALKGPIVSFLDEILQPTRYHTNIPMRGLNFTSGTQEGTPIDRLLGAMTGTFDRAVSVRPRVSGRGKSFFLGDLLTKVIFGEAGWVSTNRAAAAPHGASAIWCLCGDGSGRRGYSRSLVDQLSSECRSDFQHELGAADYKEARPSELVSETIVADTDFDKPRCRS